MRGSLGLLLAYRDAATSTSGPLAVRQRLGPLRLSRFLACSTFLLVLVPMPLLPMPKLVVSLFSTSSFCYLLILGPSSIFPLPSWQHPLFLRATINRADPVVLSSQSPSIAAIHSTAEPMSPSLQ